MWELKWTDNQFLWHNEVGTQNNEVIILQNLCVSFWTFECSFTLRFLYKSRYEVVFEPSSISFFFFSVRHNYWDEEWDRNR